MILRVAPAVTLALAAASPAGAAERPPQSLYQGWLHANEDCRGGTDPKAVAAACEYRNAVDDKMAAAGWCYGRPGESGSQMEWHRCGR